MATKLATKKIPAPKGKTDSRQAKLGVSSLGGAGTDIIADRRHAHLTLVNLLLQISKCIISVRFLEPVCVGKSEEAKEHHEEMKRERAEMVEAWRDKVIACRTADELLRLLGGHAHFEQFEAATKILLRMKSLDYILTSYPKETVRRADKLVPFIRRLGMTDKKNPEGTLPAFFEI